MDGSNIWLMKSPQKLGLSDVKLSLNWGWGITENYWSLTGFFGGWG